MTAATASPMARMKELITLEMISKAIHVVTQLGIVDEIHSGKKSCNEIAQATGTHAPSLYRVLRVLASFDIFTESPKGCFLMTPMALALTKGDKTLRSFALMFAAPWNQGPFGELAYALKTGESAFEKSMGMPLFDYLDNNPDAGMLFNSVMTDFLAPVHAAAVKAYDFSGIKEVIDVGGGHGALIIRLLQKYPAMHATIYDLPSVLEGTREAVRSAGLEERCQCVAGSFFDKVPVGGDLYILSRVIHDWDDQQARRILTECSKAMRTDSKLLLIEQVIEPGNQPSFSKITDLWMLMIFGEGRERTAEEFAGLLQSAGLSLAAILPTDVTDRLIEAHLRG